MEDQDDEVTLQEALETQEMLELQSVAVLGASDPQNCSYSKGYMKRQALYACLTCNPKGAPFSKSAGVCLACSYNCHEGHDLVELFTKRLFRCDCGNTKFPDNPCRLQPEKDSLNTRNVYSQNFGGLYCLCHRPYPDPDADNESSTDSMIQCIMCEDWLHFQHCLAYLNMEFDAMEEFELICGSCMSGLDFLSHYSHLAIKPAVKVSVDVITKPSVEDTVAKNCEHSLVNQCETISQVEECQTKSQVENTSCQNSGSIANDSSSDTGACQLKKSQNGDIQFSDKQAVAWKESLRSSLCRCKTCMARYQKLNIQYLLDPEDTMEHYEALGKKYSEDVQQSAEASINNRVNQLGRVEQIELIHGYNQFKEQLAQFLKGHAESGKVVQREDVKNFFAKVNQEQATKRRRLE